MVRGEFLAVSMTSSIERVFSPEKFKLLNSRAIWSVEKAGLLWRGGEGCLSSRSCFSFSRKVLISCMDGGFRELCDILRLGVF